jgi:hypothetical protein
MITMEKQASSPQQANSPEPDSGKALVQDTARENIRRLRARANRGLFALALFLVISIGAVNNFDFLPSFPPHIIEILGQPPSSKMISAALMLYSFSAIILILSRMMSGAVSNYSGIAHVGYLSAFFFFYHFSGAMNESFWAVFAAGLTVLGLESYHLWTRSIEEIRKEEETLEELDRKERSSRLNRE